MSATALKGTTPNRDDRNFAAYSSVAARVVILDSDGSIVLQRRRADDENNAGKLGCFGGNREGRESLMFTLAREVKEELGRNIPFGAFQNHIAGFEKTMNDGTMRRSDYYFWKNTGPMLAVEECKDGSIERFKSASEILDRNDIGESPKAAIARAARQGLIPA